MSRIARQPHASKNALTRRAFVGAALGAAGAGALALAGCGGKSTKYQNTDPNSIRVGASPSPHAIILQHIATTLENEGLHLEIIEYNDYFMPNDDLVLGKLDANYFQHQPFLDDYNMSYNERLVSAGKVHFEPMCIFGADGIALDSVPQGATVTIPSDATNSARALQLLASAGLVRLADGVGLTAKLTDVTDNPHQLSLEMTDASLVPGALGASALIVVNGNYAISSQMQVDAALAREQSDSEAAHAYANIVATREGDTQSSKITALMKALNSDDVRTFVEQTFRGAVEPAF